MLCYAFIPITQHKRVRMAKPNYSFEKRQKEIAKKKKKEEKRLRKQGAKVERATDVKKDIADSQDKPEAE